MSHYNELLMKRLLNISSNYFNKDYNTNILITSVLNESFGNNFFDLNKADFKKMCVNLVKLNYFTPILEFVIGVMLDKNKFDIDLIFDSLNSIKLKEKYSLADFCSDFIKLVYHDRKLKEFDDKQIDLYSISLEDYYCLSSPQIYDVIPEFVCDKIYGLKIDTQNITFDDVEKIVNAVLDVKKNEIDSHLEYIKQKNEMLKQAEAENPGLQLEKIPTDNVSYDSIYYVLPGLLMPIIIVLEKQNKIDILFNITKKYILPNMTTIFNSNCDIYVCIMGEIMKSLFDIISVSLMKQLKIFYYSLDSHINLYYETLCNVDSNNDSTIITNENIEFCRSNFDFAKSMDLFITENKAYIKKFANKDNYSIIILGLAYMLEIADAHNDAAYSILNNYDDYDKSYSFVFVVLVRCTMNLDSYSLANSLYGIFNKEMSSYNSQYSYTISYYKNVLNFLSISKSYIKNRKTRNITDNKLWFDVVYENGEINSLIEKINKNLEYEILPDYESFKKLSQILFAFQHPSGIRLNALGIEPQGIDGDTLKNAIDESTRKIGESLYLKESRIQNFYSLYNKFNDLKKLDIHIQGHIMDLQKSQIGKCIDYIKEIQNSKDPAYDDESIAMIEKISTKISQILNSSIYDKEGIKQSIKNNIITFEKKYLNSYDLDLMSKLSENIKDDVVNYLVTSETVDKYLSSQNDNDLDFSPALIPLTKSLELILNFIYGKMNLKPENFDDSLVSLYFNRKGNRKASIELGPCITLFKDGKSIVSFNNTLSYKGYRYSKKHFTICGGHKLIDFGKLKNLKGLEVFINTKSRMSNEQIDVKLSFVNSRSRFINDPDEYNKLLFIKGLEYVKDNYRNKVAHKDGISKMTMEACKELMISSKYLLWVLLYIMN